MVYSAFIPRELDAEKKDGELSRNDIGVSGGKQCDAPKPHFGGVSAGYIYSEFRLLNVHGDTRRGILVDQDKSEGPALLALLAQQAHPRRELELDEKGTTDKEKAVSSPSRDVRMRKSIVNVGKPRNLHEQRGEPWYSVGSNPKTTTAAMSPTVTIKSVTKVDSL